MLSGLVRSVDILNIYSLRLYAALGALRTHRTRTALLRLHRHCTLTHLRTLPPGACCG